MRKLAFCLVWVVFDTLTFSCIEQPDKCFGVKRTSADFTISEALNTIGDINSAAFSYDTDTITNRKKRVKFTVNDQSVDSAIWKIGTQKYNAKKLTLDFSQKYYTQKLFPIQLTVYKKANTLCFDDDTGTDTKIRLLTILDPCDSKLKGSYSGFNENDPNNTFTVVIRPCYQGHDYYNGLSMGYDDLDSEIINIPQNDTLYSLRTVDYGYKATTFYNDMYYLDNQVFVFDYKRKKIAVRGGMWLVSNNEINIEYFVVSNVNGELVEKKYSFKGIRK